ncbi:TylF/MycF/NovP-related O-methyltransferase [Mycobacterium terramassiliense]|nr:TylF/MycF/NovP-related O-methyltransferase [Mycobacterium terramassiliense]
MVSCQEALDTGQAGVADRAAAAGDAGEGVADGGRGVADEGTAVDMAAALGEEGRDRRMEVEISGVTLRPSNDLITAANLEYPRKGPVDGCAFQVYGWVVCKAPVARLEFVHEQSVVARCELTLSRPDVDKVYGSSSPVGFWKAIGTVGLAPVFTLEVRVVFEDGRRDVIAEIRGTQQVSPSLTPSIRVQEPAYQGSGRGRLVQRYLNLLEASLTGMLVEDAPCDFWSDGKFDPNNRLLGRDWPSLSFSMIGSVRMRNLRYACETVILDGVKGDFVETGVWRGGACILMRGILEAYGDGARRVFVADSFAGLPPPDPEKFPADAGDQHHTHSQLKVSRADVEDNFRRFGLLDERVVFLEGWFKDTLPAAPIDRLAVLRLDGDMYESTIEALDALYHKVPYGGFVIVDDYQIPACAKAVHDFRERYAITSPILPIDGWGTYWRIDHAPIR